MIGCGPRTARVRSAVPRNVASPPPNELLPMLQRSIRNKIVSIAVGLIILMVITSALSIVMAGTVGHLLDELTNKYIPAYGHLARADIRSLERGLALRRMVIAKMQNPPDEAAYANLLQMVE